MNSQIVNLNSSRYFFGSIYKTDTNLRARVYSYNRSNEALSQLPVDDRFKMTEYGSFEKNETIRFLFDMVNQTMSERYTISEYNIKAVMSDNPSLPYIGHTCNGLIKSSSFFQQAYIDCIFELKENVTMTITLTLKKRDLTVFPETLTSQHIFMFEIYEKREPIVLAGLSFTVTLVLIIIILIGMTSLICYLAYKAGAMENIDIDKMKAGLKDFKKKGVSNFKEMFKKKPGDNDSVASDHSERQVELKQRLVEEQDDSRTKKKKVTTKKVTRVVRDEEDED